MESGHNLRTCPHHSGAKAAYERIISQYRHKALAMLQRAGFGVGALVCQPGYKDDGYINLKENTDYDVIVNSITKPQGHDVFLINHIDYKNIAPALYRMTNPLDSDDHAGGMGAFYGNCLAKEWSDKIIRPSWQNPHSKVRLSTPRFLFEVEHMAEYRKQRYRPTWFVLSRAVKPIEAPSNAWLEAKDVGTQDLIKKCMKQYAKHNAHHRYPGADDCNPNSMFLLHMQNTQEAFDTIPNAFMPLLMSQKHDGIARKLGEYAGGIPTTVTKKHEDFWK